MADISTMTLKNLPSVHEFVGLPLDLIKAKPNLLTTLLSPNDGYMQTIRDVYHHKKEQLQLRQKDMNAHDPLTLIIDIDETIMYKFKWTDMFFVGQEIEYDEEKASIAEVHYMIETDKNEEQYLAHVTSQNERVPQRGAYINGELIKRVSVYQINVELITSWNSLMHIKTMTMESIDRRISATVTDTEMDTPQPMDSIVINVKDDSDKLKKISCKKLFEEYKDEVLQFNDEYVAIRPNLDKFLFLCSKIFNNVILFTSDTDNEIMNGVSDYLCNKLQSKINKPLWNHIVHNSFDGTHTKKNIAALGVDLSRIFILDSSDVRFVGLEPNRIKMHRYLPNMNDNELMDRVWPILFECHTYNDIRYALLSKKRQHKTAPIVTEKESLTATMRYLVILQYSYFKSCKILDKSHDYQANHNQYQYALENKSVYSTDSEATADDEYQTSDESDSESDDDLSSSDDYDDDDESVSDEQSESESESLAINENKPETHQTYGCVSVFNGVFNDFIAKCVSR